MKEMEEGHFEAHIKGIAADLLENFRDHSFMISNFGTRKEESPIYHILSEYGMTVLDYPGHYEGCPLLTMEMIHCILKSSESWLSLGQQNLLLMHCEKGCWPLLAFMLSALLIYLGHYSDEQKTLDMLYKQSTLELLETSSPLNPMPSQMRYLRYISMKNVMSEWPPADRALTLDCLILRMVPNFHGQGGLRPIFRIYGPDPLMPPDQTPKVLFSTPKKSNIVRFYSQVMIAFLVINCSAFELLELLLGHINRVFHVVNILIYAVFSISKFRNINLSLVLVTLTVKKLTIY
jgi:hypothetical protein